MKATCFSSVVLLVLFSYGHLECTVEQMITICLVSGAHDNLKGNAPSEHHVSVVKLMDRFCILNLIYVI